MQFMENRAGKNQLIVKSRDIGFCILILINLLPDELFHIFGLYSSTTPSYLRYKWLNYTFGVLDLLLALGGIYLIQKRKHKWIWGVAIILFLRELVFSAFSDYCALAEGRLEIYLTLIVGIALIEWQLEYGLDWKELWNRFQIVLLINVLTIYLNFVFGRSGFVGRYNAVNLDVGTTGVVAGITFLSFIHNDSFRRRSLWIILTGIGLVLSGSRINLLITILLAIVSVLLNISKRLSEKMLFRLRLSTIIVLLGIIPLIILYGPKLLQRFEASRIMTIFNSDYIEDALSGRPASLNAGLRIILKNPLGISAFFVNLQYRTVQEGFSTFPHFGFLVQYIFWGPFVLIPLFFVIKSAVRLYKRKNWQMFIPVLYLIVYNTVAGGPIVNPKIIYIFGFIFVIGWMASQEDQDEQDANTNTQWEQEADDEADH